MILIPLKNFYLSGKPYPLKEKAEEAAGFYAKMLEHDYTKKKMFNDNFWADFRKVEMIDVNLDFSYHKSSY